MKWKKNHLVLQGIRDIFKTKGRFLSLFLISALSVGIYLGFTVGMESLEQGFWGNYERLAGYSLQIHSPFPWRQEDIALVQHEVGGEVWKIRESDQIVEKIGEEYAVRCIGISWEQSMNFLDIQAGRLPKNIEEVAVSWGFAREYGIELGDVFTFPWGTEENYEDVLKIRQFTVVGMVESPEYFSYHPRSTKLGLGEVQGQFFLDEQVFLQGSQGIYLHHSQMEAAELEEKLHWVEGEILTENRELYREAGENALFSSEKALEESMEQGEYQISLLSQDLLLWEEKISQAWAGYQEEDLAYLEEIRQLEQEYEEKIEEFSSVQEELQQEYSQLQKKVQEAERNWESITQGHWDYAPYVENVSLKFFLQDVQLWRNLSQVIPLLFFCVFTVICLFTAFRMVTGEQGIIGTLQAMGYRKREISLKYLAYTGVASLLGGGFGAILSLSTIPYLIHQNWAQLYVLPEFVLVFPMKRILLSLLCSLLVCWFSSILAVYLQINQAPALLMRGKAPIPGKHILLEKNYLLWKELNFNQKVAFRNLFRYKIRHLVNISSIAMVTGLLVASLGLFSSIPEMQKRQYEEIYLYNGEITTVKGVTEAEMLEIQNLLSEHSLHARSTLLLQETVEIQGQEVELLVFPSTRMVNQFVELRLGRWGFYDMPQHGLVISTKLSQLLSLEKGETIHLISQGKEISPMISALNEQYDQLKIYMTAEYYQYLADIPPTYNRFLIDFPQDIWENSQDSAFYQRALLALDGVESVLQIGEKDDYITNSIYSMDYAILSFFLATCFFAFLVLFQLNDNTMCQRMGELATLKVLGFYNREISAYVYRENIIFTFEGVLMGVVLGLNLYLGIIRAIETPEIMLYRGVQLSTYLIAAGLTVVFALGVNLLSYFKIRNLAMTEVLKQVE